MPDIANSLPFHEQDPVLLWHNGDQKASKGGSFPVYSPLTQSLLYLSSSCNEEDINSAVSSAQAAFPAWSATSPNEKRDILLRASDIFSRRWPELKLFSHHETGANDMTQSIDFDLAYQAIRNTAGLIQTLHGESPALAQPGMRAIVSREPFGVVLAIAPWNMPFILGFRAVLAPIAAGNTVVLKGSEMSPGVFWAIASVLHEAGLPSGVLNTVYARPSDAPHITESLIKHPAIKKINFTGSTAVGSAIASLAGKYLKPTVMELGGKAPVIVCEDADLDKAAQGAVLGSFFHSGQICMASERILVRAEAMDRFVEKLGAMTEGIFGGEDMVLVNEAGVKRNLELVRDSVGNGGAVVHGEKELGDKEDPLNGTLNGTQSNGNGEAKEKGTTRMKPIILKQPAAPSSAKIYRTESFGPTVTLYPVSSDEEAINIANDTEYGLTASVYTADLGRAFKIARALETGAVHVNGMSIHDESTLPHGGVKASGWGRFNAVKGLEEWVYTKVVTWVD